MASIRLTLYFKKELKTVIDYGLVEFGKTTVKRFHNEYKDIKHRLMLHPLSSPREPLLKRFHRPYHSASRRIGRLSIATTKPTTSSFS